MQNEIKQEIVSAGLKLWQVAEKYGCSDATFSRKLRHEFSAEEKLKIRSIIKELSSEFPSTGENAGLKAGIDERG